MYDKAHGWSWKTRAKKNIESTGRRRENKNTEGKKRKSDKNCKTKSSREIMRDNKMDADREMKQWEWEYDRRTEKQKQRGWFSTSIPSPFTPLCPLGQLTGNWGRWRGELLSRQTNKLAIFNTSQSCTIGEHVGESLPLYLSTWDVCESLMLMLKVSISLSLSISPSFSLSLCVSVLPLNVTMHMLTCM